MDIGVLRKGDVVKVLEVSEVRARKLVAGNLDGHIGGCLFSSMFFCFCFTADHSRVFDDRKSQCFAPFVRRLDLRMYVAVTVRAKLAFVYP